jgi:hypothetical protein
MTSELLTERDGDIVTLTLNRPQKLNAMTKPLWGRLGEAVRALDADEACGASSCAAPGAKPSARATTSPSSRPSARTGRRRANTGRSCTARSPRSPDAGIRWWH